MGAVEVTVHLAARRTAQSFSFQQVEAPRA
jgi:hypothetical protein